MGKKAAGTPRKPRASKKRAAPGSKGLSPAECRDAALPELTAKIEGHGGAVLTCYREPLGGIGKIGRFLDPIIAVNVGDEYWTPNGRHRLESLVRLGAKAVTALVLPAPEI